MGTSRRRRRSDGFRDGRERISPRAGKRQQPVSSQNIAAYRSAIKCHLMPRFGSAPLAELATQNNRVLKELVNDLRTKYKPESGFGVIGTNPVPEYG
jgi:hypothetical protein